MPESGSAARDVSPSRRAAPLAVANSPARQPLRTAGMLEPYHDIASTFFAVSQGGDLDEIFLTAARDGDFAKIDALLRRRNEAIINIDARDRVTGNTPLIWATKRGHSKIVLLLLKHGADITLRNHEGQTAVEVASPNVQSQIMDSGEKGGAHRNLLQAAWQGNAKLVKRILSDSQVDINCRNADGLTPLLLVTRDVQLFEKYGNRLARGYNPRSVVEDLLNSRADPNAVDEEGRTALHYVSSSRAMRGSEILGQLIDEGSDIEARDRRLFSPLHCASQSGNVDIVVALLDSGSEANARGYAGATPLHVSAINGHDNVVNKLLQRGADVTIVDDSGLTPVDVAKTKKVKATLKQAWAEATSEKNKESLKPLRGPGSANQSYEAKPKSPKKKGQVIFDLRHPGNPVLYNQGQLDPRYNMYLLGALTTSQIDLTLPSSSASSLDALTPRRAAVTMLQRQLTNAEKVRKAEEQKMREVVSASTSRSRTSSATTPRGLSGRRLSPLRNPSPNKQSRRELKFSAGTKDHDGAKPEPETSRKAQNAKPGLVRECSIPVTILGLDLDDNLQEVRVKRIAHGPAGQMVSKRNLHRSHSSDSTGEQSEDLYLRGHSSRGSLSSTMNDEWEESQAMSLDMRTPSATSRLHTIEERSTTSERPRPLILDLDQMRMINQNQSPILGDASVNQHPYSRHLLPPTPVYMSPVNHTDNNLSSSSKENSPRSDEEMEVEAYCGDIKLAVGNVQNLMRPKSVLNQGNFSLEATRINSSNDSGLPEEPSPSSSNASTEGIMSAPQEDQPEEKPKPVRNNKKVSQDNNGARPSVMASNVNKCKSIGDTNKRDNVRPGRGPSVNVDTNSGAKLRQVSKDNAVSQAGKQGTIKPVPVSATDQQQKGGSQVTVHDSNLQNEVGREPSKSMPCSPVKKTQINSNTSSSSSTISHSHSKQQQQLSTTTSTPGGSVSVPNSPVKHHTTITPAPVSSQQPVMNKDTKVIQVNQGPAVNKPQTTNTIKPGSASQVPETSKSKTPPTRPPPPNSGGTSRPVPVNQKNQNSGAAMPGARPNPPPRNKSRTPSASSVSSNDSSNKEAPARPPPPNRAKTTAGATPSSTGTSQNKVSGRTGAGKKIYGNYSKQNMSNSSQGSQKQPLKNAQTTSFRLSTYIAQRDAMAGSNVGSKNTTGTPQPGVGPTIILTSQSQKHFDLTGIPDINNPQLVNKDENQNEKVGDKNCNQVVQIKVKEVTNLASSSSVDLSQAKFSEKPRHENADGPVIWDPFEGIRKQIQPAENGNDDKNNGGRTKSGLKRKAFERQTSGVRKTSVSKGKESKGGRKKVVSRPRSPRERSRSPKPEKKPRKTKKKGKKGSKDVVEAIVNENGESNVAFIGGLGWQISTECNEDDRPRPLNLNKPAMMYDSDDDETPRLTVKPNYIEDDLFVSDLLFTERQNDEMYGNQYLQLPGQLDFDDSDSSENSEFGDEDIDDLLPEAEDTVTEVIFETTPRVGDSLRKDSKKTQLLKPKRAPLRRGGTEDDVEEIQAEDCKNDSSNAKNQGSKQADSIKVKKTRTNSTERGRGNKRSPRSSPRSSPKTTPKSSPMASPAPSPKTSPKGSPRSSRKSTPRSSPRTSPYVSPSRSANRSSRSPKPSPKPSPATSPNRAGRKPITPRATAVLDNSPKVTKPKVPPRKSKMNQDVQKAGVGQKSQQKVIEINTKSKEAQQVDKTKKGGTATEGGSNTGDKNKKVDKMLRSSSKENEFEIDAMIDEILKATPHPSMSLSLKSQGSETRTKPERTEEELLQFSIDARNKLETKLNKSQNGKLFCELKHVTTDESSTDPEEAPKEENQHMTVGEKRELEKIMNSLRHMELVVSDKNKNNDPIKSDTSSGGEIAKKPPLPPGTSLAQNSDSNQSTDASPRFVRKNNSWKDSVRHDDSNDKGKEDEEDLEALVNLSLAGSEFHSDAISVASGFNDDSIVPKDSRVMTSRLGGRRNSIGRSSAMSNHESSAEEMVETIQWKRGNMLGKGAYGKVWCGLTNKGELIAVKQIELNINDMDQAEEEYEKIQEEVELLKTLKHPNIVGYLGTSLEDNLVNIFMQFVPGGSIANILARFGALEEDVFCLYTRQILEGVAYLHKNNVIHRDIKGGNIMLMHNGIIKLIDFGCAKRLCININSLNNSHARLLKSMRGTPYWMAPEVVKETGYGTKSDIWSIGCTVYEMASRKPPWADFPPMAAIFAIGSDREVPGLPDKFSSNARDFVCLCMTRDEAHRPSASDLLTHPFVQKKRKQ